MAHLEVTCITKRPDHHDPHARIRALGGSGWYKAEDDVIRDIVSGTNSYCVSVDGRAVQVMVTTHRALKYLKTTIDGYAPDNLLALPDCRR